MQPRLRMIILGRVLQAFALWSGRDDLYQESWKGKVRSYMDECVHHVKYLERIVYTQYYYIIYHPDWDTFNWTLH